MTNSIKQAVRARSDEDRNDQAKQLAKELSAKVAAKKIRFIRLKRTWIREGQGF
jgi:hypothetical protein